MLLRRWVLSCPTRAFSAALQLLATGLPLSSWTRQTSESISEVLGSYRQTNACMSTAASSSSSSKLPPPHRGRRSSPATHPVTSPALSPSISPLALPPQPKRPRKATTTTPPSSSPQSSSLSPSHSPPTSTTLPPLPPPPPTTYFCYLLRSLSPRHTGHTYIGFTTDPLRRLRQHNGDITSGAYRTARRRPWQLVAAVAGFTSKVIALQFEWQWTYPRKSKRMRGVMEGRRWSGGVRGKVEVLYELLATQPWQSMPLQVRYAEEFGWGVHEMVMKRSEREKKEWEKAQVMLLNEEEQKVERMKRHMYTLPTHMPLTTGPFDELDMYAYRRLRRERRKGRVEPSEADNVTPGEYGESDMDDGVLDDEGMVSGEESTNSGESDVEIIEQADNEEDDWASFPLTQRAAQHTHATASSPSASASRLPSPSPSLSSSLARSVGSAQLRCALCFRRSEVSEGGHGSFFSGCDQCRFVGHLTCIVQHIFKQMPTPDSTNVQQDADLLFTQPAAAQPSTSSASTSPTRSTSNPASLFSPSPAFPPTMFSSLSASLPLLPPPSTGTCPTCNARLSYPLLIERCRYMHQGQDGRRGGDVWFEEADELSISAMVREYAGRAGETKAKEKEEQVKKKKAEGAEKRKRRKVKATTQARSGDETSSTDSPAPSPKRKRKPTRKQRVEAAAISPLPTASLPAAGERNKENVSGLSERKTAEEGVKRKPTASRRVAMHDKSDAPPLFASSQPNPPVAVLSSAVPVCEPLSLPDDDVLLVEDMSSTEKRRQLMAEAAERRLGRSPTVDSRSPAQTTADTSSEVSLLAVKGSGGLDGAVSSSVVAASREYVQLDDDSDEEGNSHDVGDDVLALDTEVEDEVSTLSLSERLKLRAASAQLVASLQDFQ